MKLWDTPAKNLKIKGSFLPLNNFILPPPFPPAPPLPHVDFNFFLLLLLLKGGMGLSYFFNTEIKIFRGMKNEPFERVFRRFPHGGMAPIVRQLLSPMWAG